MNKLLVLIVALLLASVTFAMGTPEVAQGYEHPAGFVKCPFGNHYTYWTGQTKIIDGQTWYVMKCTQGHFSLSKSIST